MARLSPHESAVDRIYDQQQRARAAVGASSAAERIRKVRALEDALLERRQDLRAALWADYRKPPEEVDLSEIFPPLGEARHAAKHLQKWMRPHRVSTPLALFGSRSRVVYEPKGVVLIMSPWNFPVNLTFGPLISAIAAGNCAIVKPSEMTPNTTSCIKRIVAGIFEESEVAVVEGGPDVAGELLRKRFDHIFFTGSPRVGKIVMKAAAEHLTSVTLELGGKSPVIIDRAANLEEAARKIAWGKFMNSGQVCIAPDYALVDESVRAPFLKALGEAIHDSGGDLVNEGHAARMKQLLDDAVAAGAKIVTGGQFDGRRVGPTVIVDVPPGSAIMREEIFGPILPIVTYRDRAEVLRIIGEREKPLVMYIFSRDKGVVDGFIRDTRAGGTVINDTLIHFYQLNLPFGGVGNSGMGKSHGFYGFEAFSNARGVLEQPTRFSGIQLVYPPFTERKRKIIDFLLRYL